MPIQHCNCYMYMYVFMYMYCTYMYMYMYICICASSLSYSCIYTCTCIVHCHTHITNDLHYSMYMYMYMCISCVGGSAATAVTHLPLMSHHVEGRLIILRPPNFNKTSLTEKHNYHPHTVHAQLEHLTMYSLIPRLSSTCACNYHELWHLSHCKSKRRFKDHHCMHTWRRVWGRG